MFKNPKVSYKKWRRKREENEKLGEIVEKIIDNSCMAIASSHHTIGSKTIQPETVGWAIV
jgi:hypothetical protein